MDITKFMIALEKLQNQYNYTTGGYGTVSNYNKNSLELCSKYVKYIDDLT